MSKSLLSVLVPVVCLFLFVPISAQAGVDLVKVDKSERRMILLDHGQVVKSYRISLGGNPRGHKQQEGDERTPEGRYVLDYVNENSCCHRSMHISYPNPQDVARAQARGVDPGGFIMVHGQVNGLGWLGALMQRFDWTAGCIGLRNSDMDDFLARVPAGTAIDIEW